MSAMPTHNHTFPQVYGSPGARSRGLGLLKSLWPIGGILFAMGYLVRVAIPYPDMPHWVTSLLFVMIAVGIAATTNHAHTKISNHTKGARGEELAARALSQLPSTFTVFHGVILKGGLRDFEGGADIDHVVVTPHALYIIETKHWQGDITCEDEQLLQDGYLPNRDPIEQTSNAAKRVKTFLASETLTMPPIIPVLLFTAGTNVNLPPTLRGVILTDLDHLNEQLMQPQSESIAPATRQAIIERLARQIEP